MQGHALAPDADSAVLPPLVRRAAVALLAGALVACEHPATAPRSSTFAAAPATTVKRLIVAESIPTYEGSGQVVHPDVVRTPPGVFAHPWHLALTPYPVGTGPRDENPSVFASDDGLTWEVESGVVNPVALPRKSVPWEALSDPALVYVPESQELWLYYRSFSRDSDYVWLLRSMDAVHWSGPDLVLETAIGRALSPSVVHRTTGEWLMWTVNGGRCEASLDTHVELRRSADGLVWSEPRAVTLGGLAPWHVFVRWVESLSMWVMATNVKTKPTYCLTTELHLAFSRDGRQWVHGDRAWLVAGEDSARLFTSAVYRSAFAEMGDSLRFWYSGAAMRYATVTCRRGQETCTDSTLVWSGLGTEIRATENVPPRSIQRVRGLRPLRAR